MNTEKNLTEQESLRLITDMLRKAKGSYHETGIGPLLWGTVVAVASVVTYLERHYQFKMPFDIWLIVLFAIVPQVIISMREKQNAKFKQYDDDMIDSVWLVFGISIFALGFFQNTVPAASAKHMAAEGWTLIRHYTDGSQPDRPQSPMVLSFNSIYLLFYALPTLVTGLTKKYWPMTFGAILTYGFFIVSCYVPFEYDMLLGAAAALVCWFIPGIILRTKYLALRKQHV